MFGFLRKFSELKKKRRKNPMVWEQKEKVKDAKLGLFKRPSRMAIISIENSNKMKEK